MKTITPLVILFLPLLSLASSERDSLIGAYHGVQPDGRACHLFLKNVGGKTDLEFTDFMSSRTLWNIGQHLETQLARRAPTLRFAHDRGSLGDVTVRLEIQRDSNGLPTSMRGTVAGWLHTEVDCRGMGR